MIPMEIIRRSKADAITPYDSTTEVRITKVQAEKEGLDNFGLDLDKLNLISVQDLRFDPPLEYYAKGNLPSDEKLAELAAEPDELKRYNDWMLKQDR
jgi:hypothetical protein